MHMGPKGSQMEPKGSRSGLDWNFPTKEVQEVEVKDNRLRFPGLAFFFPGGLPRKFDENEKKDSHPCSDRMIRPKKK